MLLWALVIIRFALPYNRLAEVSRNVGPVGRDTMGDNLLAELEQCGVDTEYTFRAEVASPRTLILLDDTGERTIIAVGSGSGPSSFPPVHGPNLTSADCVYIEGYEVPHRHSGRG